MKQIMTGCSESQFMCCAKADRFSGAKFVMFSLCRLRCAIFNVFFVRVACVEILQRYRIR
jgi:hypothetical protein